MTKRFAKIYIETTNVCNLNCSFCPGTKRQKRFMSVKEFDAVTTAVKPYTDFIYLHLMGEPLLHPDLPQLLQIAEDKALSVIITTNGTMLSKVKDTILSHDSVFKVSISVHSFEANDSNMIFDSYISDCMDFAELSSEKGIITVFRLWNGGGMNTLNDRILSSLHTRFGGEWVNTTRGIRIRDKLHIEFGDKFDWPMQSDRHTDKVTCYGLRDHIGILCDGTVVPCCLDHDGDLALGNIYETPLEEILNDERTVHFRKYLDTMTPPHEMCESCGFAMDKFIRYI